MPQNQNNTATTPSDTSNSKELIRPGEFEKTLDYNGQSLRICGNASLVDVVTDLRFHKGKYAEESWFTVSNLTALNGDTIGLQVHFFVKSPSDAPAFLWVNFGLINEKTREYRSYDKYYALEDVTVSDSKFYLKSPDGEFGGDEKSINVKVAFDDAIVELDMKNNHNPLVDNAQGRISHIYGLEQYEYAFVKMKTSGRISIGNNVYDTDGISWLDRQFGVSTPATAFTKDQWAWFNPQLDNGVSMSIAAVYEFDKSEVRLSATAVLPDGSHVVAFINPIKMYDYWTSPATGKRFPTQFDVSIPSLDAKLHFDVPYKAQEILPCEEGRQRLNAQSKYEGKMNVSGSMFGRDVRGVGYVELAGVWK
ncbi:lipocalin family protein [Paraburkholderia bannensis]|uniref:lipocalin family protein n=1 Tax=Paraburkholderia bannensis TaxID=765414 RepID=UPI0005A997F9|nr:lipocalin family protein [Paraburkholderia bannensis]